MSQTVQTTETQREIWLSANLGDDSNCAYNEGIILELTGKLDGEALKFSFHQLVSRHEALRTTFSNDGCLGFIHKDVRFGWNFKDVSAESNDEKDKHIAEAKLLESANAFDLSVGPLIRARLIIVNGEFSVFIFTAHHIVCDGWSTGILVSELGHLYNASKKQELDTLLSAQKYSTFAMREKQWNNSSDYKISEEFWTLKLQGITDAIEIPSDNIRPHRRNYRSRRTNLKFPEDLIANLRRVAALQGCSFFQVMFAAFNVFIYRLNNIDTLVVGVPVAGQSTYELENVVGHCVSILPIVSKINGESTFSEFLNETKKNSLDSYEHAAVSYSSLLKKLPINRDSSRPALVSFIFNVEQGFKAEDFNFEDLKISHSTLPRTNENFEIFINITGAGNSVTLECQSSSSLFEEDFFYTRLTCYKTLLESICKTPHCAIDNLDFLAPALKHTQVVNWNHNWKPLSAAKNVYELFQKSVQSCAEKVAIASVDESVTYAELNKYADEMAELLKKTNVGPDHRVAVILDRNWRTIGTLLAIWKCKATYIPVDPYFPAERIRHILEDSCPQTVVTKSEFLHFCDGFDNFHKIILEKKEIVQSSTAQYTELKCSDRPDNRPLAYAIFTSGSTGRPKGVAVPHCAAINFLLSMSHTPGFQQADDLLAITTISFDISVLEMFLPLVNGGSVYFADKTEAMDPYAIKELLASRPVTHMQATPTTWRMLLAADWPGKKQLKILCGGESLPRELVAPLLERCSELWNMYGPTETTVWSTCHRISDAKSLIHVGRPIDNTSVFILNSKLQPVFSGTAGELYIGGVGVAAGYLRRSDLTAEKYIKNPFATEHDPIIYATGDLATFGPNGEIICLGRADNQIKLRGFRVELGDIEASISQFSGVKQIAAGVREKNPGDVRLIAWYQSAEDLSSSKMREFLQNKLPEYMIPQIFMRVEKLPLTPNLKVDRKKLPDPFLHSSPESFTKNAVNELPLSSENIDFSIFNMVLDNWKIILQKPSLGAHENFFSAGGHSILAAQSCAQLRLTLGIQVRLKDIFEFPTVDSFSKAIMLQPKILSDLQIQDKRLVTYDTLEDELNVPFVLSRSQLRLWWAEQVESQLKSHHLPTAFRIHGRLYVDALKIALQSILERHDMLRVSFTDSELGEPKQIISKQLILNLPCEDLSVSSTNKVKLEELTLNKIIQFCNDPFILTEAPLIRFALYKTTDTEHVLAMCAHHLVFDGWSFDILIQEISDAYANVLDPKLPKVSELKARYSQYAKWQREQELLSQSNLEWWKSKLHKFPLVFEFKTDKPRPKIRSSQGAGVSVHIDKVRLEAMANLCHSINATPAMGFCAVFCLALQQISNQKKFLIGLSSRARNLPEFETIVGCFVKASLIGAELDRCAHFLEFLLQIKKEFVEAMSQEEAPFEQLVQHFKLGKDASRSAIFQVFYSYQDARRRNSNFGKLPFSQVEIPTDSCSTDLGFWLKENESGAVGELRYASTLFDEHTIQMLCQRIVTLIDLVTKRPESSMEELVSIQKPIIAKALSFEEISDCELVGHNPQLLVYATHKNRNMTTTELRQRILSSDFSENMPFLFEVPLIHRNLSGKIDTSYLPQIWPDSDLNLRNTATLKTAPVAVELHSEILRIQNALRANWQKLLGIDLVSDDSNFFDLGGHSLLSMQMIASLHKELGVRIKPIDVTLSTLAQIAAVLAKQI